MFNKHSALSLLAVGLLICQHVAAADKPAEVAEKVDKPPASAMNSPPATSNDLNIPQNISQMLTNGGSVAVGIAVVAALAALAMPMFGLRYCQLLGNCDSNTAYPYSANNVYQNDMYAQYPQTTYPSGNTYQKRSVEYVGPVLHMLKAAYDKYGQSAMPTSKKVS